MRFNKISTDLISKIAGIVKADQLITDIDPDGIYGRDETEDFNFPPEAVVLPKTTEEVSRIMRLCYDANVPVTPRGAGTGLSGGALPVYGGLVMSLEKMNRIIKIDERNFMAIVEPGVINEVFQNALAEKNLFYPPDPASKGSSMLGGNVAENAGGPKAVKYGVTSNYILNLEVVLPDGEVIMTGANTIKNATGYNLTQLLIGSEGTLGIVTKIIIRLIPKPKENLLMLATFFSPEDACEAVASVMNSGIIPSGLEFMERAAIEWSCKYSDIPMDLPENAGAQLLIEVDGNDIKQLMDECEIIGKVLENHKCIDVLFAESTMEKDRLWKIRRNVAHAVHANSIYKEEDTVVPRAELPQLLKFVKDTGKKYGFDSVCYGHAGDGNLHVNILKSGLSDEAWNTTIKEGIREIFLKCAELGGTISGEHGIGYVQKEYMDTVFNKKQLEVMMAIKKVFDPKGVLNPGKVFKK